MAGKKGAQHFTVQCIALEYSAVQCGNRTITVEYRGLQCTVPIVRPSGGDDSISQEGELHTASVKQINVNDRN